MNFRRQVSHALDEEHRANLDIWAGVEQAFPLRARTAPAGRAIPASEARCIVARHIEQDIGRHFDSRSAELFPRLEAAGDGPTSRAC